MHLITEFARQMRQHLLGAKQGRPKRRAVRVPPAMHNCTWSVLEMGLWMKPRLGYEVIPAHLTTPAPPAG